MSFPKIPGNSRGKRGPSNLEVLSIARDGVLNRLQPDWQGQPFMQFFRITLLAFSGRISFHRVVDGALRAPARLLQPV